MASFPSFNPQAIQINPLPQVGPTLADLMQSATQYARYRNAASGASVPKAQMLATVSDPSAPNGVRQVTLYGKTEKERTAELNRILGDQALAVLQNDEAVQKKLAQLESSSVNKQAEILADIRKNDMPRLQKKAGDAAGKLFPEMLKGYDQSISEQRKAIQQDSGWKSLLATAGTEASRVGESLLNVFRSDEERLASAERVQAMRQKDLEDNAYLRDQALRAQENEGVLSRTFTGEGNAITNIGNAAIETAGTMGLPLAAAAAGGSVGGLPGMAIGYIGGALLNAPLSAQDFYERVAADETLTREQKIAAIASGANNAMATGAAIGGIVPGVGRVAGKLAGAMIGKAAPRVVSRIPTTRGLRSYALRDVPQSAIDIATFSGASTMGGNAVYSDATGNNVPITQGLGEAMSGALLSAPFFGLMGSRRRETRRAYDQRIRQENAIAEAKAAALGKLPDEASRAAFEDSWNRMTPAEQRAWHDNYKVKMAQEAEAARAAKQQAEQEAAKNAAPGEASPQKKASIYANPHLEALNEALRSNDKDNMHKWTDEQKLARTPEAVAEIKDAVKNYLAQEGASLDDIKKVVEQGSKSKEKLAELAAKDGLYTSKKLSTPVRKILKELLESDEITQFAANLKAAKEQALSMPEAVPEAAPSVEPTPMLEQPTPLMLQMQTMPEVKEAVSGEQAQRESSGGTQPPAVVELAGQEGKNSAGTADIAGNRGDEAVAGADVATPARAPAAKVAGSNRADEGRGLGREQIQSVRPNEVSEAPAGREGPGPEQPEAVSGRPAAEPAGREGNTGERVEEREGVREAGRESVGETDSTGEQSDVRAVEEESSTVLPDGTKVQDDIPADMPKEALPVTPAEEKSRETERLSKSTTIDPLRTYVQDWMEQHNVPIEKLRTAMNADAALTDRAVRIQAQRLLTKRGLGDTLSAAEKTQLKALGKLGMKVEAGKMREPIEQMFVSNVPDMMRDLSPETWIKLDPKLLNKFSRTDIYNATRHTKFIDRENRNNAAWDAVHDLADKTLRLAIRDAFSGKHSVESKAMKRREDAGIMPVQLPENFDQAFKQSRMKNKTEFAISVLNPSEAKKRTAERPRC